MGDRCGHRHEARVALKCRLHRLQCFPSSFAIAYVNAGTDIAAKLALKHEIWPPNVRPKLEAALWIRRFRKARQRHGPSLNSSTSLVWFVHPSLIFNKRPDNNAQLR